LGKPRPFKDVLLLFLVDKKEAQGPTEKLLERLVRLNRKVNNNISLPVDFTLTNKN